MPLVEKRKRILVICPHPEGYVPGQRLKYEQYFNTWRENGYDVVVLSFMSVAMQNIVYKKGHLFEKIVGTLSGYWNRITGIFQIRDFDIVYIFLWVTPFGLPFFEWIYCKIARKMVYDIDDLVFLKNIKHENKILSSIKGKAKPIFLMKRANHVITCTPYLDEIAKKYNSNTTDISSTINTDTYIPVNKYNNNKTILLGWSGSHTTSRYLYLLAPVFKQLKDKVNFKLLVIGDREFHLDNIDIEAYAWSADKEIELLQRIDIGLYPLPLDEEWVKGKSGLKALQYMALGIPTIATDVGCNDRVISTGADGFLVKNEEEWVSVILTLIENPQERERVGNNARKKVEHLFSLNANKDTYLTILNTVAKN